MERPWEWKYTHKLKFHWLFPFTSWLSITIAVFCSMHIVLSMHVSLYIFSSENILPYLELFVDRNRIEVLDIIGITYMELNALTS